MPHLLTDTLNFGRYKGYSIKEIFCGWNLPTQYFYSEFLEHRLQGAELFEKIEGNETCVLKISRIELLKKNEIEIDFEKSPNYSQESILGYFNSALIATEHYPWKTYYGTTNDFIIQQNKINGKQYQLFADNQYIFWCFKENDNFFVSEENFNALMQTECNFFSGISLTQKSLNSFTYDIRFSKGKCTIDTLAKEKNALKYNSFLKEKMSNRRRDSDAFDYEGYGYEDDLAEFNSWSGGSGYDDNLDMDQQSEDFYTTEVE